MTPLHEKPVSEILELALQEFEEEHRSFWVDRLPTSDFAPYLSEFGSPEECYEVLKGMGEDAFRLVKDLAGAGFEENYELQQAIETSPIYLGLPIVALQIRAAREFAEDLPSLAERASGIIELALEVRVSPAVSRYAGRLGRCYLAGFDSECVILCRSVLDAALKDVLTQEGVEGQNMKMRIDLAVERGLLDPTLKDEANCVRLRGDKAVHDEPGITKAARETLEMTLYLVHELFTPGETTWEAPPSLCR